MNTSKCIKIGLLAGGLLFVGSNALAAPSPFTPTNHVIFSLHASIPNIAEITNSGDGVLDLGNLQNYGINLNPTPLDLCIYSNTGVVTLSATSANVDSGDPNKAKLIHTNGVNKISYNMQILSVGDLDRPSIDVDFTGAPVSLGFKHVTRDTSCSNTFTPTVRFMAAASLDSEADLHLQGTYSDLVELTVEPLVAN